MIDVRDEGPVRWLTLNRPFKRNALDAELVTALKEALDDDHGGARCLAITGAGTVFSAGADLAALQEMQAAPLEENLADSRHLADLFGKIARHPLPIIAALNGPALGGGAGLAVACDLTFAVPGVEIGFVEVRIGFVPAIVLNFLVRAVGEKTARRLCLTGTRIGADDAAAMGLLRVVEDLGRAVADAGDALAKGGPDALARTKRLFVELPHLPLDAALEAAAAENAAARGTDECREGIAAFLEKRKPDWIKE